VQTLDEQIANARVDRSRPDWRTRLSKPTKVAFDPAKRHFAVMETSKGTLGIRLLADTAPMHVTSFAYLAGLEFFDGLAFHRVIDGFMAQGGCPLGSGTGGPGYRMDGEYVPSVRHDRPGILSSANAGPGTDGSQFFLTFVPTPWLDGKHTIFGCIEEGLDVLPALEAAGSPEGRPREKITIESVRIEARA
jgi:peptidyl-prolyl cis-trans isomerase B (cyclophilin B)